MGFVARYDYRCSTCEQVFEVSRPMAEADAPVTCPDGHVGAKRQLAVFATSGFAAPSATACGVSPGAASGCCGGACG